MLPHENNIAAGLVTGVQGETLATKLAVAALLAIALYNATELILLLAWTFNSYRGLYFWSLVVSDSGIILTTVGAVLHFFVLRPLSVALILSHIGFYAMVPGQSFILYSRLHLVYYNENILRVILYFIIIYSTVVLIPTTTTMFGSAYVQSYGWNQAYRIVERLQLTAFAVLECVLSCLYIGTTIRLLQLNPERGHRKRIMYELVAINLLFILMDIALLVLEYLNLYYMQVALKSLVYSIKVKLELAVLGELVAIPCPQNRSQAMPEFPDYVDPTYLQTDFTHAGPTGESQSTRALKSGNSL